MNMHRALRIGFLAGLATIIAAASDTAPIGDWEGKLDTGNGSLRVVLHVSQAADGKFAATLDSPDQGATGIPIDPLTYKEPDLHFAIESLQSTYDGKMSHDNSEITGEWKQSGLTLALVFKRRGK